MKHPFLKISTILLMLLLYPCLSSAQIETARGFRVLNDSLTTEVAALGDGIIHVTSFPTGGKPPQSIIIDETTSLPPEFTILHSETTIALMTPQLLVEYHHATGNITFLNRETGEPLLSEESRSLHPVEVLGDKAFAIDQHFQITPEEGLYGLGQYQDGFLNFRNQSVNLVQANREIASPVLLSTNHYLLYWDNYSKTLFQERDNIASFTSEMGDGVSYYFFFGEKMHDALASFRHLTGEAPLLPKSAFGLWMSKERYDTFDELTDVVKAYRKRAIPLDNIVQDWQYWGKEMDQWCSMVFDSTRYPQPRRVIDELHNKYHVKIALSVWPSVGSKTAIYKELESEGLLFDVPTWAGYKVIDLYHPKAREIYWDHLYKGLYTKGIDAWWIDATEPSFREGLYQDRQEHWSKEAGMTAIGPFHRYLNTYSLFSSQMMYDNLRKQSDRRVSILTRSAFAGQQKYATITWSGDIYASWDVYRKQIPAGLNLCMTGIPYWTTDIGGFRVISEEKENSQATGEISDSRDVIKPNNDGGYTRGLKDSAYLELYTRWFQYGAFNPIFRAHGTEVPREIWHFGEEGSPFYEAQRDMINLRYSLLSYIYSAAWGVTSQGATMMRPLVMDFTDDKKLFDDATAYLFGPSLLVHPITTPMYYTREGKIEHPNTMTSIYLPQHAGHYWYALHTDSCYSAGETIRYDAPLAHLPLFVKGGAIIPRNKPVQHVGEETYREMEITLYAGADATFDLYEDDNETYNYEQGDYSVIQFRWDDKKQELTITPTHESATTTLPSRHFHLRLVTPQEAHSPRKTIEVEYKNQPITLQIKNG